MVEIAENTLFLGNGFSRSIFENIPSWGELFEENDCSPIRNYTILYEVYRLKGERGHQNEGDIKRALIQKIKTDFADKSIKSNIHDLDKFGGYLRQLHVHNIITTNYDNGIEFILMKYCGYIEQELDKTGAEQVYSIRTYKEFIDPKTEHSVKLWKIHGDLSRIASITLGFDQYCGSLARLENYVKGTYTSAQKNNNISCKMPMKTKCSKQTFDGLSWIELFFRTNVYIVGSGMDFSEIDIWWLLNKRARFMLEVPEIENAVTYLYNKDYEKEEEKPAIFAALRAFQVSCSPIISGPNYISSIFESMASKRQG